MDKNLKLPKGITGFTSIDNYIEIPEIDKDLIVQSIIDLTTLNSNYVFISIAEPNQSTNYYVVTLLNKSDNKKYDILFNAHYPYFCSMQKEVSWCEKIFGNLPDEIVSSLVDQSFIYLPKSLLNMEISKGHLSELASSEREQIDYWESKTIGEIIFNHYD